MHFSAIATVFAAVRVSNVFADASLESREPLDAQVYDSIHARDFEVVIKRSGSCGRGKRSVGGLSKRNGEVEINDPPSSSSSGIDAEGVNGCSVVYVWADKLHGLHMSLDNYTKRIADLKTKIGTKAVTNVVISAPTTGDETKLADKLKWTNKAATPKPYGYKNDNKDCFSVLATFAGKGQVSISNHPFSKSPTPDTSSSRGKSPSRHH